MYLSIDGLSLVDTYKARASSFIYEKKGVYSR